MKRKCIAIFASGSGSNAVRIIEYFKGHPKIHIALIVCNNPRAAILTRPELKGIPNLLIDRREFIQGSHLLSELEKHQIEYIALAGFLLKIPDIIIQAYPHHILNIHPALLPKYGGEGMYGHHVHQKVFESGDEESGMTIHLVNENYDEGQILFQARCPIQDLDSPSQIADRVLSLEHRYYASVIESYITREPAK